MAMRFQYDPFSRDEERERERLLDERLAHEYWSREQSKVASAAQRENTGVWIKRLPDEIGRS